MSNPSVSLSAPKQNPYHYNSFISRDNTVKIKENLNTVNGMSKLGIPLTLIGMGIINSGIGRHKIGKTTDILQNINHSQKINYNNIINDTDIINKTSKIKALQHATFISDVATLFVIPAPITIPLSIILNAVNWNKTGKLKKKLSPEFNKETAK